MGMDQPLPLAFNLVDLAEYIVPLIVMVMWGASQLMGEKPKQAPKPRPRPAQPVQPAQPVAPMAGQQGGNPPTLEETLRREVEEFMRRAQGKKPERPAVQPAAPGRPVPQRRENRPAPRRVVQVEPVERTRRLTDAPGSQTTAESPGRARPAPTGAGVSQHVSQHLSGAQAIAKHVQNLGADVAQADERMQEHLKEKFAHQLGALDHQAASSQQKAARPAAAQQLIELLTKPGGMRQVIVAGEILRRPEERWSRGV
jgi:hypothetical protein